MPRFSPKNISLLIVVGVSAWIATGLLLGTSHKQGNSAEVPPSGAAVDKMLKMESLKAQPFQRVVTVNGFTEANRMVELKPQVDGQVVELPVKKGEMVKAGQVIVRLDSRDRKEKLAEAKAALEARNIEYAASQTLESKGYRPRIGLAQAKANLEQARSTMAQAQLNVDNMLVTAPFAGRLEELNIELGDVVLSGFFGLGNKPMARVMEDDPILVKGQVAEKDLSVISRNAQVEVMLSDGRPFSGTVTYLGQAADTESRSFPVEVTIGNKDHVIPIGMTATIKLLANRGDAYLVSASVLALDDAGKAGVKTVDDVGVVHFMPVEVLASDDKGVWIGGLPATIRLITQGQAFVNEGQRINAK